MNFEWPSYSEGKYFAMSDRGEMMERRKRRGNVERTEVW
jgi:hypothetical protein